MTQVAYLPTHSRYYSRCCSFLVFPKEIGMVERVVATDSALALIERLRQKHGPLMFYQSGGCCDGSAANCLKEGEYLVGPADLLLGKIGGFPFYISKSQYEYWQHTQIIIDVIEAQGGGFFSLEGPEGVSFHSRARLFTDDEWSELSAQPLP